jgi:hypothetical protein
MDCLFLTDTQETVKAAGNSIIIHIIHIIHSKINKSRSISCWFLLKIPPASCAAPFVAVAPAEYEANEPSTQKMR